ncbi:LacI family DNA-binding transcriptional regulator [Aureimonas sp. AU22]|uniref:LacI family DNA-binding transcriptional regulator n=1 Tax=Aureimonas sp. AU22 TaxID=1638162 RepID=UPI000B024108|nr:LacI family DNA-binding transcriptional regulator [Aureimonas sp. AU22]
MQRKPDEDRIRRVQDAKASERRPTMIEVARLAGVSQSSVSMVLNRMEGARITDATRQRVEEAARTLGYELPGRRRLRHRDLERRTIAYLVDEISTSPHPVVNLDGARDAGWEQGYLVSAHVTRSDPALEATTLAAILADPSVLGIVYSTIFTRRITPPEPLRSLPSVLLNCYDEERSLSAVLPAEVIGGFTATTHLTELGHRRIGFINGEPWMDAAADRLVGYRQGLATSDLPFDESLVRHGDWYPTSGYQHAKELLTRADRPTAIFCASDQMAVGALEAAVELGLKVPDDVSILGYDNQELARYTNPPLSTVVLPNYEMGRRAVETLIRLANANKPARPHLIKIDGPLVARNTTGHRSAAASKR